MTSLFRGRFSCKLDNKGRLSLPSGYRQSMDTKSQEIVVTNALFRGQRCLDVYTFSEWLKLEERIFQLPSLKSEVQFYQRFYLASGQVISIDTQKRLLIPAALRKYASLEEELVLVGMGQKFEIWSQVVWDHLYGELTEHFEDILSTVADMELQSWPKDKSQ